MKKENKIDEALVEKDLKSIFDFSLLHYSEELRLTSNTNSKYPSGEYFFNLVKSSPVKRAIVNLKTFTKSFYKLPDKIRSSFSMIRFSLFTLSKGLEHYLPPNYRFHDISKEIPNHYTIHIGGDYAMRFQIESNQIILKDILSHSQRGY